MAASFAPAVNPMENQRNVNHDEIFFERVRYFQEFLESDYGENEYQEKIQKMIAGGDRRLVVNINHIRQSRRDHADGLLNFPGEYLPAFDYALKEVILARAAHSRELLETKSFYVGIEGSFGAHFVNPRNLTSSFLGRMICIEGIVTRCMYKTVTGEPERSLVRPKVTKSIHFAEKTSEFHERLYSDGLSLGQLIPTGSTYPKEDEHGNKLTTEYGLSSYRDFQTISLQEMPERAPAGLLPRPIDVVMDDDLVDKVKPGDRVQLVGVYRSVGKKAAEHSATFRTLILANNVRHLAKEMQMPNLSEEDIAAIRKVGKRPDVFELLSTSLAPSIYGHDYIKKSVLLLLLGGMEKNLENGTHIRGDINMLLVGDPSTAKSQVLRFVLSIAPLAIATTGRGSSGVGLTAAVTNDKETGERRLEAGAMVLADRGVVCIDEFDKMSDVDRVAIHEVMEQQTVTIAKAGIHTSLNARCSVIAAANPSQGQYIDTKKPFQNIHLPDSLLSRFDLLFIVKDTLTDEFNKNISEHVLRLHRYVPAGVEEGVPIDDQAAVRAGFSNSTSGNDEEEQRTDVFERYNALLHIGIKSKLDAAAAEKAARTARRSTRSKGRRNNDDDMEVDDSNDGGAERIELLSIPFLKKYLHYAKSRIRPVLTQQAADSIADVYTELRSQADGEEKRYRTVPITARTLETLIRLSTAHAKARLSNKVEQVDTEVVVEILKFALFEEVKSKPRPPKKRRTEEAGSDHDEDDDEDEQSEQRQGAHGTPRTRVSSQTAPRTAGTASEFGSTSQVGLSDLLGADDRTAMNSDTMMIDSDMAGTQESLIGTPTPARGSSSSAMSQERLSLFQRQLNSIRRQMESGQLSIGFSSSLEDDGNGGGFGAEGIMLGDLFDLVNRGLSGSQRFENAEVLAAVKAMSEANQLYFIEDDGRVLFI